MQGCHVGLKLFVIPPHFNVILVVSVSSNTADVAHAVCRLMLAVVRQWMTSACTLVHTVMAKVYVVPRVSGTVKYLWACVNYRGQKYPCA